MKGKKLITTICIVCVLATLLCMPAFATVTESNGDGYALYNGVKLPSLPDLGSKYAFVAKYTESGVFRLFLADDAIAYTNVVTFSNPIGYEYVDGVWRFIGSYGSSFNLNYSVGTVIWALEDVYKDTGELYLASSNLISLNGYNVIEWDGALSGNYMEIQSGFSIQRIGDYLNTDVNGVFVAHNSFADEDLITVSGSPVGSYTAYPSIYTANATIYDNTDWIVAYSGGGISSANALLSVKDSFAFSDTVTIPNGLWVPLASVNGATAYYTPLVAYRTTETPPDEGGGDDDDPQPPFGG